MDAGGHLLGLPLVAVRSEDSEARLHQAFDGLPVEIYFRLTTARLTLEAVMRSPLGKAFRYNLGVSFEDDGQVGLISLALSCHR